MGCESCSAGTVSSANKCDCASVAWIRGSSGEREVVYLRWSGGKRG